MRLPIAPAVAVVLAFTLGACGSLHERADPLSDAPEARPRAAAEGAQVESYAQALRSWHGADDVNAWIGARFEYDPARAMRLSETQRGRGERLAITAPDAFFAAPSGVCVDLSRFAVETMRVLDAASQPGYLMIEFAPLVIAGNTLRLHWVATFHRNGQLYVFADSKRPGHIAGPYASAREFIEAYARYRGRDVVAFRERDSYERRLRTAAPRELRAPAAPD